MEHEKEHGYRGYQIVYFALPSCRIPYPQQIQSLTAMLDMRAYHPASWNIPFRGFMQIPPPSVIGIVRFAWLCPNQRAFYGRKFTATIHLS